MSQPMPRCARPGGAALVVASATLAAQNVEVELVLQTRNTAHVAEVVAGLNAAGFEATSY